MKLVSCKSALNPTVVYSTDVLIVVLAVVLVLLLTLCTVFFSICVVMLALWSPSLIAANLAFCFTSCVVMLAFWSNSTAAHFAVCFTS